VSGDNTSSQPEDPASLTCSDSTTADGTTETCPLETKEVLTIRWDVEEAWCGDPAPISGTTRNYSDGEELTVAIKQKVSGASVGSETEQVMGNEFIVQYIVKDVLPAQSSPVESFTRLLASTSGVETPRSLKVNFIPNLPKTVWNGSRASEHFELEVREFEAVFGAKINFVKGWAGAVVKLPATTNDPGKFSSFGGWDNSYWLRQSATGTDEYYSGATDGWKALPTGFTLADANNVGVGFYKSGTTYTCQYGSFSNTTWPEAFADWSAADNTAWTTSKANWERTIADEWSNKFYLKRHGCTSTDQTCCRYTTRAWATFEEAPSFTSGMSVLVAGGGRANDSLWFVNATSPLTPSHEYGHHLGNPDEYGTGTRTPDGDGMVGGIDANCVMGNNRTPVKKRHLYRVAEQMAAAVRTHKSKTYTYDVLPVSAGGGGGSGGGGGGGGATGSGTGGGSTPPAHEPTGPSTTQSALSSAASSASDAVGNAASAVGSALAGAAAAISQAASAIAGALSGAATGFGF
jgi:hypothetical protein